MPSSPGYSPPTLSEMRAVVARTLRDTDGVVFGTDALNDFITEGLSSLSGYRPIEAIEAATYNPANYGDVQLVVPLVVNYIWQVEARNDADVTDSRQSMYVPYGGSRGEADIQTGWDYYGGSLFLGRWTVNVLDSWVAQTGDPGLTLILYGYRDRVLPQADADVLDLEDPTDQLCLTRECRALGFQLLSNDRALYQQWLAATNNTDVSPTQLNGMLGSANNDVEHQRKRSAIYRRQPIVGPQYP